MNHISQHFSEPSWLSQATVHSYFQLQQHFIKNIIDVTDLNKLPKIK